MDRAAEKSEAQTQYATAQRDGWLMKMQVVSVRGRNRGSATDIYASEEAGGSQKGNERTFSDERTITNTMAEETDEDNISFAEGRKNLLLDERRLPAFLRQSKFQKDLLLGQKRKELNPRLLTFLDKEMEKGYSISVSSYGAMIAFCSTILLFAFGAVSALMQLQLSQNAALVYALIALISLMFGVAFFMLWKKIKMKKDSEYYAKKYFQFVGTFLFASITLFSMQIVVQEADRVLSEIEICIMAGTITVPGEYPVQLMITIYANIFPLLLLAISTSDPLVIYRCMMSLVLNSIISISILKGMEIQRKNSYHARTLLREIKSDVSKTKSQTKSLLSNLYPIPVMNSMIQSLNQSLSYEGQYCGVISVHINTSIRNMDDPLQIEQEAEKAFIIIVRSFQRHNIHKISSLGLCITGVTGLFGETAVNLVTLASEILAKCSHSKNNKIPISLAVGYGPLQGGMIKFSKTTFDIYGEANDEVQKSLEISYDWEIRIGRRAKTAWVDGSRFESGIAFDDERDTWVLRVQKPDMKSILRAKTGLVSAALGESSGPEVYNNNDSWAVDNQPEEDESLSDPFLRSRKEKGVVAYLGDFLFKDMTLEKKFQKSLRVEKVRRSTSVQILALTIGCVLFGLIDISLLKDSIKFSFLEHFFLFARFYVVVPIMVFSWVAVHLSRGSGLELQYKVDYWRLPETIVVFYSCYVLLRIYFVYENPTYTKDKSLTQNFFFYSELYEAGLMLVSLLTMIPLYASIQYVVWIIYTCYIFVAFGANMGTEKSGIMSAIIIWALVPMSAFSLFVTFRDYVARKEFLDEQNLEKVIETMLDEHNTAEQTLASTLTPDIIDDLKNERTSSRRRFANTAVVNIRLIDPYVAINKSDAESRFELISDYIKMIESTSERFQLEILKATSSNVIILSKPEEGDEKASKTNASHIEVAISFSRQIQEGFASLNSYFEGKTMNHSISIDVGYVGYGVVGAQKFVCDCFGDAVYMSSLMSSYVKDNLIRVSYNVYEKLQDYPSLEVQHAEQVRTGRGRINLYSVSEKVDPWKMFRKQIDWIDDEEITISTL